MSHLTLAPKQGKRELLHATTARAMCVELAVENVALLQRENERDQRLIDALLAIRNEDRIKTIIRVLCVEIKLRDQRIAEAKELATQLDLATQLKQGVA